MKRSLLSMLMALVAIMMPIGASALSMTFSIGASGIASLYYPFDIELPSGLRAFYVTGVMLNDDGTVKLVEEEIKGGAVPAQTAVIIRGETGDYSINIDQTQSLEPVVNDSENLLKGTLVPIKLDVSNETLQYLLYHDIEEDVEELADWQAPKLADGTTTFTLRANRVYLKLDPASENLKSLPHKHLQHTHGGCEICGQVTVVEAAWGTSADDLTSYGTLAETVAADGEEGSTIGYIKLLADVESENGIYVEGGNFTLDLNGHTISSESHTLYIRNQSNVTIVDNSETKSGKVISSGEGCFAVCVDNGASVTINGGTYESTHYALYVKGNNSSVTINGGSYSSSYLPVYIDEGCSATIVGGTFEYADNGAIRNVGNLVVKGGIFTYNGESFDATCSTIDYFGGSIDFSDYPTTEDISSIIVSNRFEMDIVPGAETILLPEGYCFFEVEEGTPVSMLVQNWYYYIDVEPAKYTIAFNAGDGEGEMEGEIIYEGNYTLPECTFTAPEGMMFKAWQIGEKEYQPCDVVTIEGETTITALWTDYVPQIIIRMHDSYGDSWHGDAIVVKKNGEEIGIATMESGDGADVIVRYDYDNTAEYTFYWQFSEGPRYPDECSFEIFIDDEEVFAAVRDEEENTSDCQSYEDGELIHTIEGKAQVVESLTIVDGEQTEYINDASFTTVGTLTYTRTLPNQMWNSLYVPFEIPVSELAENYDVAYINDVHSYDTDDDGEIDDLQMEVIKITTGKLWANYPYLIRAKNEGAKEMNLELTDATLRATEVDTVTCTSVFMQFDVIGTYNIMSQEDNPEILAISTDGAWKKLAEETALKPFRLYLTLTALDGSPVVVEEEALTRMRIVTRGEEGDVTGIEDAQFTIDNSEMKIYDLSGRRVKTPAKGGVYIINGKKVVF